MADDNLGALKGSHRPKGRGKGKGKQGRAMPSADTDMDWRRSDAAQSTWAESASSSAGGEGWRERREHEDRRPFEAAADEEHPQEQLSGASRKKGKGGGKAKHGKAGKHGQDATSSPPSKDDDEGDIGDGDEDADAGRRGLGIGPRVRRKDGQPTQRTANRGAGRQLEKSFATGRMSSADQVEAALNAATTVAERLAAQFRCNAYECMICLSKIGRDAAIWSCNNCWAGFHLKCIRSWIQRSNGEARTLDVEWQCPGCRYHRVGTMPDYTCFCGKMQKPEYNPHFLVHSCGEVCGRDRGCGHKCTELCHPGPCPPCQARGPPGQCHCGLEHRSVTRCGEPTTWSCGAPCGRTLPCGVHTCPLRCHAGPCPPCAVTTKQYCYCGAEKQDRLCGSEEFGCQNRCNKWLDCGKHKCERLCHPGACGECPRDPEHIGDKCACGKTVDCYGAKSNGKLMRRVARRAFCTDPLPLCLEICGKPRALCGHTCKRTCHEDVCGTCEEKVQKQCRCGKTKREVVCSEVAELFCKQPCKTLKSCGHHRCDILCCSGVGDRGHEDHLCLLVCGKPLACGVHTCEDFCHLGRCKPCRVVQHEPLCCACGASRIEPPVRCGTNPPLCDRPCGQEMACGHICRLKCHFGEHQLCCELVSRRCLGDHRDLHNQPCHIGAISCGQPCGRALSCGHTCNAPCHAGPCPPCTQVCGAPRVHCEHRCEAACHHGSPCPDVPCKRKLKVSCACGLRVEEKRCGASSSSPKVVNTGLKCGSMCSSSTSAGPLAKLPQRPSGSVHHQPRYALDLLQLAQGNRRYVLTLEDFFIKATAGSARLSLPPCERSRQLLAVEYARVHWRLRTVCRKDAVENWWNVAIEASATSLAPNTMLSEVLSLEPAASALYRSAALDTQPQLRFVGVRDAGDEVYDLMSCAEGFIGIRPGREATEAVAYFERSAAASAAYRHVTGQPAPVHEPLPVRSALGRSYAALRVVLKETFSTAALSAKRALPAASEAPGATTRIPQQPVAHVPDSWEEEDESAE